MRIFLRQPGRKADMEEPMIVKRGMTIKDVATKIHRRFKDDFRFATVTGTSTKFPNQKVGLSHVLLDGDVLKIVLEK